MTEKFDKFKNLLIQNKLSHPYLTILKENGFDDWEMMVELNLEILSEIS